MKFIRVTTEDETIISFPEDIARLRSAFAEVGISISKDQASLMWRSYSENWAAGWLVLDGMTNAEIIKCLDQFYEVL